MLGLFKMQLENCCWSEPPAPRTPSRGEKTPQTGRPPPPGGLGTLPVGETPLLPPF